MNTNSSIECTYHVHGPGMTESIDPANEFRKSCWRLLVTAWPVRELEDRRLRERLVLQLPLQLLWRLRKLPV